VTCALDPSSDDSNIRKRDSEDVESGAKLDTVLYGRPLAKNVTDGVAFY